MTDISSHHARASDHGIFDAIRTFVSGTAPAVLVSHWAVRRRDRRELANLDEHMLDDIGLSASEAYEEASKPFWRA